MATDEELILTIIPSLIAQLIRAEQDKGMPLTEAEVHAIRDRSQCIAMPRRAHEAGVKARGYDDLDPENCWREWQEARQENGKEWGLSDC